MDALASECIECSGKFLPWTLLQTTAFKILASHFIWHIWHEVNALANDCIECSGYWLHWMLWQVSDLNTLANQCLVHSCISFNLTHLTWWSKCNCKWLHWMLWLLIALNALASNCLEHSFRPMPWTLLHTIASLHWTFLTRLLYSECPCRWLNWMPWLLLHWVICLEHSSFEFLAVDCSSKCLPWTRLPTIVLDTLDKITGSKCSCRWLHWMFWLLIALNALASICLEHSCRPMP